MEIQTSRLQGAADNGAILAILAGYGDAPLLTVEASRFAELKGLGWNLNKSGYKLRTVENAGKTLRSQLELFDAPLVFFDAPLVFFETGPIVKLREPVVGLTYDIALARSHPVLAVVPKPTVAFANPLIGLTLHHATKTCPIIVHRTANQLEDLIHVRSARGVPSSSPVAQIGKTVMSVADFADT